MFHQVSKVRGGLVRELDPTHPQVMALQIIEIGPRV
jgi:hypothetical protein